MKKILETLCCVVILLGLILGGAEKPDGSCDLLWTGSCLAIVFVAGWGLNKLEDKKNV